MSGQFWKENQLTKAGKPNIIDVIFFYCLNFSFRQKQSEYLLSFCWNRQFKWTVNDSELRQMHSQGVRKKIDWWSFFLSFCFVCVDYPPPNLFGNTESVFSFFGSFTLKFDFFHLFFFGFSFCIFVNGNWTFTTSNDWQKTIAVK